MRAETSKRAENTSSQLIRKIAEGTRMGDSVSPALSLQDVFSDSGNASGSLQKTFLPAGEAGRPVTNGGKGRNSKENQSENQLEVVEDLSKIRSEPLNFRCM